MSSKSGPCSSSEEDAVFLLDFFQLADSRCEGIRLNVIMLPPRVPAIMQAKIVPGSALRGEIFQTWTSITIGSKKRRGRIHSWSDWERKLISSDQEEKDLIEENSQFIAESLGVESIVVYPVGEGEDIGGKAIISFPLEPGIAFM